MAYDKFALFSDARSSTPGKMVMTSLLGLAVVFIGLVIVGARDFGTHLESARIGPESSLDASLK